MIDDRAQLELAVAEAENPTEKHMLAAALTELDFDSYKDIRREHAKAKWRKFLDLTKWLRNKFDRAATLELVGAQPKRILDLGCGPGHFGYVCRQLGHEVIGVDVPGDPLFRAVNTFLGTRFEERPVLPKEKLPDYGSLDLITALSANFYRRPDGKLFDEDDWRFFIDDMRSRLASGGRLFLHLNKLENDEGLHVWDDDFQRVIEQAGAQLNLERRVISFTA